MSIRIHFRSLLRSRAFLITAVALLGLGLGVNIILFNTVTAILWRPLAFPNSGRLAALCGRSASGDLSYSITGADAYTLHQQTSTVGAIGLAGSSRLVTVWSGDESLDLAAARVNSGYFQALAIRPVAGRFFGSEEDLGGNGVPSAILTESAWRTRFAADPAIVGRVLPLQDGSSRRPARIVGIVPGAATLPYAADAEILLPIAWLSDGVRYNAGDSNYRSILRLQPGVSLAVASGRLNSAIQATERGSRFGLWGNHWVEPVRSAMAPVAHRVILLVYGSSCLLLLLTCANLASLFTARGMARTHETSVHLALGATRWHLLRSDFQEAFLIGLGGTALALLAEAWARPLIPNLVPQLRKIGPELMSTSPLLLAFAFAICLLVSLVVTLASCLRIETAGLSAALSQGGRGDSAGAGRFRAALAAAQLAIVLTLLTVAGLVGRSFLSAIHTDPGFDPQRVLTFSVSLPGDQRDAAPALFDLRLQFAASPGVQSATFALDPPVGATRISAGTAPHTGAIMPTDPMIAYRFVGPAYFETLGARLASGRTFSDEEVKQARGVVILNRAAARLLFQGGDPLGRTVQSAFGRTGVVVGVLKDIRTEGLDRVPAPMVYMPYMSWGRSPRFLVRAAGEPGAVVPLLKARAQAWNAGVVLQRFESVRDIVDSTVHDRVLAGALVGGFALLGLIISSVGLYGTLEAQVQQRRREIGVRIALGAGARNVVGAILGGGLRVVAIGAVAGLAASAAAARLVQPYLYGVHALDPASFLTAFALLSCAALAACLIPALNAARLDPIRTLNV